MSWRESSNSRWTAWSSARSRIVPTSSQRSGSRSCSAARTCPIVCVANTRPPPGLSRISRASSSWRRAQGITWSPGSVSSFFGRRTSIAELLSGKRGERLAGQAVDGPVGVRPRAEPLVEADRLLVPIEDRPLQSPAPALDSQACESREEQLPDALAAMLRHHEKVLEVHSGAHEAARKVVQEQRESNGLLLVVSQQNLRVRALAEQAGREHVLGHHHLALQLLETGEPANQLGDDRHVVTGRGSDADGHEGPPQNRRFCGVFIWVGREGGRQTAWRHGCPRSSRSCCRPARRPARRR